MHLDIDHGERVLVLGPSGGGKSSFLMAIAGLHERSTGATQEGSLRVDGRAPRDAADDVGIVFQDPEAQIVMGRAGDDVAFGLEEHCVPTGEIWSRVDTVLRDLAFPYGREHRTSALSGGEKQRLALASVLALRPRILLLDEPTADLDPEGAALFYSALARIPRSTTVLLVEHRVREALTLVDRVVAISGADGVIADGSAADVFAEPTRLERAGIWGPAVAWPARPATSPGSGLVLARDVRFRYPDAPAEAIRRENGEIREGEAVAVVGPNGAGKSTLLLLLAGLVRPTTGTVTAAALDPARPRVADWPARALPSRIAMVFQDPGHQFIAHRVIDDAMAGALSAGVGRGVARARCEELLERLGLLALCDANPHTLSGGERRRLGIAGALAARPRAVILDEPTRGQDPRTFSEIVRILEDEKARGVGIAFSSHDDLLIGALADRNWALA